uniref:Uncharacterized protein n=1 Tax=Chromera velia CCMP2878 TaxID=1169474 RepID=A0A0G4G9C7_9ALVE|eukprot:Cvel_577.t1-p1 / transcript=Cvel_577.t1 / gene=Cvel_577 / organism=Chromera_velia_CCMP2878 / gene_product=hypothetical protein / transcript_product=hypothetical protein / location=Cvel_scaffold18:17487-20467(+) / protein_length=358 / sequence_SO=supercontig / SO=protein_coding / is_pseudo=false
MRLLAFGFAVSGDGFVPSNILGGAPSSSSLPAIQVQDAPSATYLEALFAGSEGPGASEVPSSTALLSLDTSTNSPLFWLKYRESCAPGICVEGSLVELVRQWDLPYFVVHWGHPVVALLFVGLVGGLGARLGLEARRAREAFVAEQEECRKETERKIQEEGEISPSPSLESHAPGDLMDTEMWNEVSLEGGRSKSRREMRRSSRSPPSASSPSRSPVSHSTLMQFALFSLLFAYQSGLGSMLLQRQPLGDSAHAFTALIFTGAFGVQSFLGSLVDSSKRALAVRGGSLNSPMRLSSEKEGERSQRSMESPLRDAHFFVGLIVSALFAVHTVSGIFLGVSSQFDDAVSSAVEVWENENI